MLKFINFLIIKIYLDIILIMIIIVVFVIDDNIGDLIVLFVIIVIYIDKFSVFFSKLVYLVNLICSFSNLICIGY